MTDGTPDVAYPDDGPRVSRRISDRLRRARISRDLAIGDVADALKIRTAFIEAMEDDRFGDLPGPAYISGFLRTYANFLGLDGEQLVAMLKEDDEAAFEPAAMELPVPIREIRRPTRPIILVSLVVATAIVVVWYAWQESRTVDIDLIPEVPDLIAGTTQAPPPPEPEETAAPADPQPAGGTAEATPPEPEDAGSAMTETPALAETEAPPLPEPEDTDSRAAQTAEPAEPEGTGTGTAQAPPLPGEDAGSDAAEAPPLPEPEDAGGGTAAPLADTDDTGAAAQAPLPEAEPAAAAPAPEPETGFTAQEAPPEEPESASGEATAAGGAATRIELRAVEETWVQVETADGAVLVMRILLPGDVYSVPDRDGLTLDTGNAGGLEIRVDGRLVPPLGESGSVMRDVLLEAASLQAR